MGRNSLGTGKTLPVTLTFLLALAVLFAGSNAMAAELSVPAEYAYDLRIPGNYSQILRPSSIYYDAKVDECFVADQGNNRIAVFDKDGNYIYEFSGSSYFSSPSELAVDKQGFIWVLASSLGGRDLTVFDFDGLYLRTVSLPAEIDGQPARFTSFDLDDNERIYLLERNATQIVVLSQEGRILKRFPILVKDYTDKERAEEVIGRLRVNDGLIVVPCGITGVVEIYTIDGKLFGGVGYKGSNIGALGFPVAAIVKDDSLVMVLDKHRFNVVCYDLNGKFRGEFGGKGTHAGWFYHPTLLEIGADNQVYVGQIFNSRVQACRIPDFICPSHETGGEKK